jgi:hypothetical protein
MAAGGCEVIVNWNELLDSRSARYTRKQRRELDQKTSYSIRKEERLGLSRTLIGKLLVGKLLVGKVEGLRNLL